MKTIYLTFLTLCLCASVVKLAAQTGGTFNVSGTAGQHVAGTTSNGAIFDLHGGFWFQNLTPTAAAVSITGRVTTSNGQGIRGTRLTLTSPNGSRRTATTSTFGSTHLTVSRSGRLSFGDRFEAVHIPKPNTRFQLAR